MRHLFFAILISAFCYSSYGQINAADSLVQVITYWDNGESFDYTVTHEKFMVSGADTLKRTVVKYDVTLGVADSLENGYTMRWRYNSVDIEGAEHTTDEAFDIIYSIDEFGVFLGIVNMDEITGFVGGIMTDLLSEEYGENAASIIRGMVDGLGSKEFLESYLFKDIQQYHLFHGGLYELGGTYEDISEATTLGGTPVDAYTLVYLDEIYEEDEDYVMVCYQEIDGDQLTEASFDYLDKLAVAAGGERLDRTRFAGTLSNETVTVSQIHDSGWVLNSQMTVTVKAGDSINVEIRSIEMKFED